MKLRQALNGWRSGSLLLAAGAVSGLALPPIGQWWVLGLTFPVLLWRLNHAQGVRSAFVSGLAFGLGYFVSALHWIGFAFLVDADAYLWMMPFAVGGLALIMALYWGVAVALVQLVPVKFLPRHFSLPVALALMEYLRGHLFTGFPWAAPGLAADGMGGVLQLASLIGMPGLTLLVLLWALVPYAIWQERRAGFGALVLPVLLLAGLPMAYLWGEMRLGAAPTFFRDDIQVSLVQPNVAQSDKWRSDNAEAMLEDLLVLSRSAQGAPVNIVIWPEASVPFLLDEEPEALRRIAAALEPGQTLLAGSIRRNKPTGGSEPYFTSILQIDSEGQVQDRYDKWRLVPGGEFLPLEWLLEPLGFRKVVSLPESLTAGNGPGAFELPGSGTVALLICYEAIFPHDLVGHDRPDWIVNVTNDGWFGNSVGPYQHLAQVRMRAVEQGLPVARAANTGISAMIDPLGRILTHSPFGTRLTLQSPLPRATAKTHYAAYGDAALALMMACLLLSQKLLRTRFMWRNTEKN